MTSGASRRTLAYRRAYVEAEGKFLQEVERRTGGMKVQIFDDIGTPVFRATPWRRSRGKPSSPLQGGRKGWWSRSCGRRSVSGGISTCTPTECACSQCVDAIAYAEAEGWMPIVDERMYGFDQISSSRGSSPRARSGCSPSSR